jgi:predicted CoA-binding protein
MNKPTLVIGTSENEERYSNVAVKLLRSHNHTVYAIGNKEGQIEDTNIITKKIAFENVHTVTLYISKKYQTEYYDYILSLKPNRIIFNPGTENIELEELANKHQISAIVACTLVMLKTRQY